jgi:hypothetical protein
VAGALSRVDAAVEVLDASPIAGRSMAGDRGASRVPGISRTPGTARAPGAIGLPHRPALRVHDEEREPTMSIASALRRVPAVVAAVALAAPALAGAADPPRYHAYYDAFDRGPANVPGLNTSLVPQGLTYWAARDALIVSYYDTAGGPSRIAIVDRQSGRYIKTLLLRTTGHVGGLGMTQSGHLWVATNGKLFRYPASTLDRGAEARTVDSDRTYKVRASSFVGVRGNDLWVGQFERSGTPRAYPYRVNAFGGLQRSGPAFPVPTRTQGMAVTDRHFIFSRSFGRDNDSQITSAGRGSTGNGPTLTAPNMAEGMVFAGGEIHVLYESGAKHYSDADYRVRTIHHAPVAALGG